MGPLDADGPSDCAMVLRSCFIIASSALRCRRASLSFSFALLRFFSRRRRAFSFRRFRFASRSSRRFARRLSCATPAAATERSTMEAPARGAGGGGGGREGDWRRRGVGGDRATVERKEARARFCRSNPTRVKPDTDIKRTDTSDKTGGEGAGFVPSENSEMVASDGANVDSGSVVPDTDRNRPLRDERRREREVRDAATALRAV